MDGDDGETDESLRLVELSNFTKPGIAGRFTSFTSLIMKVFLGADHRGFELKEKMKEWLKDHGYAVEDLGAHHLDPEDDYPDFAFAVAEKVAESPAEHRGILFCGSGVGMDVAANKFKNIRATVAWNRGSAEHARSHDDANVVSLAADWTPPDVAGEIVRAFLETPFSGEERHVRRLEKIEEVEEKNFK